VTPAEREAKARVLRMWAASPRYGCGAGTAVALCVLSLVVAAVALAALLAGY
jgi:hypothetical protein